MGTFKRGRHAFHAGCPATENDFYRSSARSPEPGSDRAAFRCIFFCSEFDSGCEASRYKASRRFDGRVQACGFVVSGEQCSNQIGG
jgi:hypothetical protein